MNQTITKFLNIIAIMILTSLSFAGAAHAKEISEALPQNHDECMRMDEKYRGWQESSLKCTYVVGSPESVAERSLLKVWDQEKFNACVKMGGDTANHYGHACELFFYNPDYVFPKKFKECSTGKESHTKRQKITDIATCRLQIAPNDNQKNQEVEKILIKKCYTLGGTQDSAGCTLVFKKYPLKYRFYKFYKLLR